MEDSLRDDIKVVDLGEGGTTDNEKKTCDVKAENPSIPNEYTPISMWWYFGYEILFSIPIIGLIVLIIFSVGGTNNHNLKNYARSKFCLLLVALALIGLSFLIIGTIASIQGLSNIRLPRW